LKDDIPKKGNRLQDSPKVDSQTKTKDA